MAIRSKDRIAPKRAFENGFSIEPGETFAQSKSTLVVFLWDVAKGNQQTNSDLAPS